MCVCVCVCVCLSGSRRGARGGSQCSAVCRTAVPVPLRLAALYVAMWRLGRVACECVSVCSVGGGGAGAAGRGNPLSSTTAGLLPHHRAYRQL